MGTMSPFWVFSSLIPLEAVRHKKATFTYELGLGLIFQKARNACLGRSSNRLQQLKRDTPQGVALLEVVQDLQPDL